MPKKTRNILIKVNKPQDNKEFNTLFKSYLKDRFTNKDARTISERLNNQDLFPKINHASRRQMNNWNINGLLNNKKEENNWPKYSYVDLLWLSILFEMREFGFSIENLKILKKCLERGSTKNKLSMPVLEFCIMHAIGQKERIILSVFKDGSASAISYEAYKEKIENNNIKSHINIDINGLIQTFLPKTDLKPIK